MAKILLSVCWPELKAQTGLAKKLIQVLTDANHDVHVIANYEDFGNTTLTKSRFNVHIADTECVHGQRAAFAGMKKIREYHNVLTIVHSAREWSGGEVPEAFDRALGRDQSYFISSLLLYAKNAPSTDEYEGATGQAVFYGSMEKAENELQPKPGPAAKPVSEGSSAARTTTLLVLPHDPINKRESVLAMVRDLIKSGYNVHIATNSEVLRLAGVRPDFIFADYDFNRDILKDIQQGKIATTVLYPSDMWANGQGLLQLSCRMSGMFLLLWTSSEARYRRTCAPHRGPKGCRRIFMDHCAPSGLGCTPPRAIGEHVAVKTKGETPPFGHALSGVKDIKGA